MLYPSSQGIFRGNVEIVSNVLWAISGGHYTKIRLMDNTYLTYEQTESILDRLLAGELVSVDPTSAAYELTSKGSSLLELYTQISELMPSGIPTQRIETNERSSAVGGQNPGEHRPRGAKEAARANEDTSR